MSNLVLGVGEIGAEGTILACHISTCASPRSVQSTHSMQLRHPGGRAVSRRPRPFSVSNFTPPIISSKLHSRCACPLEKNSHFFRRFWLASDPRARRPVNCVSRNVSETVLVETEEKENGGEIVEGSSGNGNGVARFTEIENGHAEIDPEVKKRLWKAAIKLPMYWVAVVPVLVGAGLAVHLQGFVSAFRTMGFLVGAVSVIAWLNLSNDVFDAATGVDVNKPESVVNLTGNCSAVFWASIGFLVAGVGCLATVIAQSSSPFAVCGLLAGAIMCGYVYQGPPFRLSYQGLGEPLCLLAFGPLATSAFFLALFSQPQQLSALPKCVWASSLLVGITTIIILFCSHFHQFSTDKLAGKMSPVVRLGGTERAVKVLQWSVCSLFVLTLGFVLLGVLPWTLGPLLVFPVQAAHQFLSFANENYTVPAKIRPLKIFALKLHSSFGMALTVALMLTRI